MESLASVVRAGVILLAIAAFVCLLAFPLLYLIGNCLLFVPPLSLLVVGILVGAVLVGLGYPSLGILVMLAGLLSTVILFRRRG